MSSVFFHVTCLAHLGTNCALKLKAYYQAVNDLVSSIHLATAKDKTRMVTLKSLGSFPHVIVTRRASWLKGAIWYSKNLPDVIEVVKSWSDDVLLVKNVKDSILNNRILVDNLCEIKENYECLME